MPAVSCKPREGFGFRCFAVMNISKIGSKTTYHRCIKELSHFKYIIYFPSHNPFKGSQIKMSIFGTSSKQPLDSYSPISGQALVSYINNNKQIENINKRGHPQDENEVILFFKKGDWPKIEAQKFYNHYQSNGWKIGGKSVMVDWHAAAKKWMLKAAEIKNSKNVSKNGQTEIPVDQNRDNLKTIKDKNYHEPL